MSHHEVQQKHLEILVRNGGFQFTDSFFPYTSGQIGPYYVQSAVVMNNGKDYAEGENDFARYSSFIHFNINVLPYKNIEYGSNI